MSHDLFHTDPQATGVSLISAEEAGQVLSKHKVCPYCRLQLAMYETAHGGSATNIVCGRCGQRYNGIPQMGWLTEEIGVDPNLRAAYENGDRTDKLAPPAVEEHQPLLTAPADT